VSHSFFLCLLLCYSCFIVDAKQLEKAVFIQQEIE
jgi:hypothetical protein